MRKIQDQDYIQWRHVSSNENPADLGSRGGKVNECSDLSWNGPSRLAYPEKWPSDIVTSPTKETRAEAKVIKGALTVTMVTNDALDQLIQKWNLWKTIRIGSWVARFLRNCGIKCQQRTTGPITTGEANGQTEFWIRNTQVGCQDSTKFQEDQLRLNLQKNEDGIYECRGCIQSDDPIYLPDEALFSKKLVMHLHTQTLHGGVQLTMAKV